MNDPIDRRRLLRLAGTGALGVAAASVLSACSSSATNEESRRRTARSALSEANPTIDRVRPLDPSQPWWLQGDFAPVQREIEAVDLEVEGTLPRDLSGLYVRNGSNPRPGWSSHWFLGDGMVHGVMIENGKATWYRNRFVHTTLLAAGGGLTAKGPPGGAAGLSNVSIVHHGGKLLTLGEVGFPYELRANDLSTVGAYDFGGRLRGNMTAHPKIDPDTGAMHFFGYNFFEPYLLYHVADRTGALVSSQPVAVKASTMIHDFAITDRDVIFWEMPVLFDMQLAIKMVSTKRSRIMPYVWKPEYGSRIGVMPLGGPTSAIRWVEIDPCYVFHGMNAFRDGDDVVLDVSRMAKVFDRTTLGPPPHLHRWRVNTAGPTLTFSDTQRTDTIAELPSIDKRRTGRPYTHGWRVVSSDNQETVEFAGVVHTDANTGVETRWDPGARYASGEWLFVATGAAEAEGLIMTYVYDKAEDSSALVALDARDVAAGPVARIKLPQRVPYGFHGTWVPTTV